jgi:DNA processing protein
MADIPTEKNELFYQLALSMVDSIGPKSARRLIKHFGSAKEVFRLSTREWIQASGMTQPRAQSIAAFKDFNKVEKEISFTEKHRIGILSFFDPKYPNRLKHCEDAPLILYAQGDADLSATRMVSIVGTRKVTRHGKEMTRRIVEDLLPLKPVVVSGLAYGVDFEAHKACVEMGLPTVAVLGHGLNKMYPSHH